GVVLLSGEAGIGKSRLVRELRARVETAVWLECRCAAEQEASPLHPFAALLAGLGDALDVVLDRLGMDPHVAMPLLAPIAGIPLDARWASAAPRTAELRKEQTLDVLVDLLLRLADASP